MRSVRLHGSSLTRQRVALVAAAAVAVLLLLRHSPNDIARRARSLRHFSRQELAVRRLGGSAAAFDRRYFIFLESARRRMPRGVRGMALFLPHPSDPALYLASYHLAPAPVLLAGENVPPGWIAAVYGRWRPRGWKVIATLSDGALLVPDPEQAAPRHPPTAGNER